MTYIKRLPSCLYGVEMYKIRTSFDSRALIEFGEKFWIESNSVLRLEKENDNYKVHLLSGNIQRENIGTTLFYIDGEQVNTKELVKGGITELTDLPIDDVSMEIENPDKAPEALNKRQIYQTFKLHQRFIEKCFIKHYARLEGRTRSGKVWIAFNVSTSGRLESPQIDKSDYSDAQFHNCLKEVVSRVQLKNYSGPSMQIKFPINIELPE